MLRFYLFVQSLALAIFLTWPAPVETYRALGSVDGDGIKHVWNLWWMRQEFLTGTLGLHTNWVGFPGGMELYPIEPLNGVFAALLPLNPVALSNVLAVIHLTLLGLCSGWLGELVSFRMRGALMSGALAQCSAFTAFTLHVGVGELRELWWLPLGFACLLEAQQSRHWKWFAALGAVLVSAMVSCFYIGFFLAIGVLVHALSTLRRHRDLFPKYAATAVVAALLTLAPFSFFAKTYDPDDDRASLTFAEWVRTRPLETFENAATEPAQLIQWRASERDKIDRQLRAYTGGRYLGVLTIGLALLGAYAQPRRSAPWLAVGATGIVLSFGTVLWVNGEIWRPGGGGRVVLPLAWVNHYLGYYAEPINFPARFLALAAVALPAAAASASRWRWTMIVVPLACLDMVSHDLVPWPREVFELPDVRGLTADGLDKGVLNVTPFQRLRSFDPSLLLANKDAEGRSRAIAAQIAMQRRFDIIPIERMDFWSPDGLLWALPLPLMRAVNHPGKASLDQYRRDLWLIRDRGFDKLLLTHGPGVSGLDAVINLLSDLCGEPEQSSVALVWTVPEIEATDDEGSTWRTEHQALVDALERPKMGAQYPEQDKASQRGVVPPPRSDSPAAPQSSSPGPPPPGSPPPWVPSSGAPSPPASSTIPAP